jgi:hypothetical protein
MKRKMKVKAKLKIKLIKTVANLLEILVSNISKIF